VLLVPIFVEEWELIGRFRRRGPTGYTPSYQLLSYGFVFIHIRKWGSNQGSVPALGVSEGAKIDEKKEI
jgi:hypothetical protein